MDKTLERVNIKQAILSVYLARSEKELLKVICDDLPALCSVEKIELSESSCPLASYSYAFKHKSQAYFVHFYSVGLLKKAHHKPLKQVGEVLAQALVRLQQYRHLKNIKEQWEIAFDVIATPISLIDLKGGILRANKTFQASVQMSKAGLLNQNSFKVFLNKPAMDVATALKQLKKRETVVRQGGEKKTFEISLQTLGPAGGSKMYLFILRDISDRIKMEQKVAKSAQLGEIDIISTSIAHELNNPIAGIQALLQTMQVQEENKPHLEHLKEMTEAIQRCGHIVNHLLKVDS